MGPQPPAETHSPLVPVALYYHRSSVVLIALLIVGCAFYVNWGVGVIVTVFVAPVVAGAWKHA